MTYRGHNDFPPPLKGHDEIMSTTCLVGDLAGAPCPKVTRAYGSKWRSILRRLQLRMYYRFSRWPQHWTGVFITVLSLITRFWHLDVPASVAWDEAHFGKFANHYIKREFFFDVHPPLGKMLIALVGVLTGYNGQFEFKDVGEVYGDTKYMGMRVLCATMGALIAPCVYGIMTNLEFSLEASALAALMIVFDPGVLVLSQYILLDPILMFFIVLAVYCYCRFYNLQGQPFTGAWWRWMSFTGVSLACAFGTKWVGLFVILFIGMSTVMELWELVGDLSLSVKTLLKHFFARVACLIILPVSLYLAMFYVHFAILSHTGPGDSFMSSAFQTTLVGGELYNRQGARDLAFGSELTIKSFRTSGGLLHSHPETYPKEYGLPFQQITTYSHKDDNNLWQIKKVDKHPTEDDPVEYVRHGDLVKLEHVNTGCNLHTHNKPAPLTTHHRQVTCTGFGLGDSSNIWQVLVKDASNEPEDPSRNKPVVQAITQLFHLYHPTQKCYLSNQGKSLPLWGFEQGEVTCNPKRPEDGTLWNIETITDKRLPIVNMDTIAPSFLANVVELHQAMIFVNNDLLPKEDDVVSRPWEWPIMLKGQPFTGWDDDEYRIFLLGNPVIWLGNLICAAVFLLGVMVNLFLCQRGCQDVFFHARRNKMLGGGLWVAVGFLMHYVPFFFMVRILYIHHYYPAHLFACMLAAMVLDEIFYWVWVALFRLGCVSSRRVMRALFAVCIATYCATFVLFSPWAYGMLGTKDRYAHLQWSHTWEFL